jgi:hypothetical protein
MIEVPSVNSASQTEDEINYLYVTCLDELHDTNSQIVKTSHVIVVGHEDTDAPKPRRYELETARRTMRTGEAIGAIIGGSYTHEVTGASYNTGLLEHVDGRISRYLQVGTAGYMEKPAIKVQEPGGTLYTFRKYTTPEDNLSNALNQCRPVTSRKDEYFNTIHIQKLMFEVDNNQNNLFGVFNRLSLPYPELEATRRVFVPLLATVAFVNGFGENGVFYSHETTSARLTEPENASSAEVAGFRRQAATGRVTIGEGQPVPKSLIC